MTYIIKINGLPNEREYNALPFGRRVEYRNQIEAFKAQAQSVHFSAKRKSTAAAFKEFRKLYNPAQWFLTNRDSSMYHDDSFQVWYTPQGDQ